MRRNALIITATLALLLCLAGTILDPVLWASGEPLHTLILSWLALDISAAQLLGWAVTHQQVKDDHRDRSQR